MQLKIIGALVIVSVGILTGGLICSDYKRQTQTLEQLIRALDYMGCELQYRLTPLPALCRDASGCCQGALRKFWLTLAIELDNQLLPDAAACVNSSINAVDSLPERTKQLLRLLGASMGRFDLQGQMEGIEAVRQVCRKELEHMLGGQSSYLRSCRTLAICSAAALAILFI